MQDELNCEVCGRPFRNSWTLKNHMRSHQNRPGRASSHAAPSGEVARPYWQNRNEPDVDLNRPNMHTFEPDKALPVPVGHRMGD